MDDDGASSYTYQPLPSRRYIRLLKITDSNPCNIVIDLEAFCLDNLPEYDALSYTWGKAIGEPGDNQDQPDSGVSQDIECDQHSIGVTENLFDALVEISRSELLGYVWVDALCINQSDNDERESQVLLMGDIFANTRHVIVWLGKDTADLDAFIYIHGELHSRLIAYEEIIEGEKAPPLRSMDPKFLKYLNMTLERWLALWESYARFYRRRRWFSRVWVIQEIAFPQKIIVRCACARLDWERMVSIAVYIQLATTWWPELIKEKPKHSSGNRGIIQLDRYRRQIQDRTTPSTDFRALTARDQWYCSLLKWLRLARAGEATEPKDKIYALLGIAKRCLPPGMALPITPNYKKDCRVAEVYSTTSAVLLLNMPTLEVLSHTVSYTASKVEGLPSWSPDWSCPMQAIPFPIISHGGPEDSLFNCSGDLSCDTSLRKISGSRLELLGNRFDRITVIAIQEDERITSHFVDNIFELVTEMATVYHSTGQDRVEVLWRTILADAIGVPVASDKPSHPAGAGYVSYFQNWLLYVTAQKLIDMGHSKRKAYIEMLSKRNKTFGDSSVVLPSVKEISKLAALLGFCLTELENRGLEIREYNRMIPQEVNEFQAMASRVLLGRRLFRTSLGCLGVGPKSMKVGDLVYLLQGGIVPFILRPSDHDYSSFTLLGEAYVHGFMHGEMLHIPGFRSGIQPIHIV